MAVIRTTPDRERAKSLLKTIEIRLDSVLLLKNADIKKFASKITEEYYEIVLELVTALMSVDGYKVSADTVGGHVASIQHMRSYTELGAHDIELMDDLRKLRIGIKYYGRRVSNDYLQAREKEIVGLIRKLQAMVRAKLHD